MDYNLLKVLTAVVEAKSVSAAAQRLNLSQPATSNALSRLRAAMNDPVLIRSGNQMLPTARAIQAAKRATSIKQNIEAVFQEPPPFNPATSIHRFKLALTDHGMQTVVPTLLEALAKHAPNIELDIRTLGANDSPEKIGDALSTNELDFLISRMVETPKVFNAMPLFKDNFATIVSTNHPRIKQKLSKKQYQNEKHILVSFTGDRLGLIDESMEKEDQKREIAHTVNNFFSAALMVEKTDLLCTVSQKISANLVTRFGLSVLPCPIKVDDIIVGVHWCRAQETTPEHKWFIAFMKELKADF